ncbi:MULTISPECIES: DUF2946 family protein [unclassified Polynucleobacter]|uniref:DUF2946 family protein n=1 Tax=unclassified Polynucleobacter TaxID=2640945 RepID=UPI000BC50FD9|nr:MULTISPECIES: DUF2946 family protein [unclassified Polynucleobacter]OYY20862.1 MAG: hypothetical protein B7Y67_04045 [Polynucleobacter sp. 35-46-11]OZA77846.1 MAG: hypothetical protein B7X71_03355 [Polynucleobacter sp. 39-46-10]
MDEQVLRSLIKWPNVPHCFGWLALDRRGQWRMRDEFAQANQLAGSVIQHAALNEFISRNYACDSSGRYFFQNGPQRVFITLDATPFIARIIPTASGPQLSTQCGTEIKPQGALSDEKGNIYITGIIAQSLSDQIDSAVFTRTETLSVALLHDHDLDLFSDQSKVLEDACSFRGSWLWNGKYLPIEPIHSAELSERFYFVKVPSN